MTSPLSGAGEANKPKSLDQVRQLMRLRHYSLRTEEAISAGSGVTFSFTADRLSRELRERYPNYAAGG